MRKAHIITISIVAAIFLLSIFIFNHYSLKKPQLVVTNSAPYNVNLYASTPTEWGSYLVEGPFLLEPGATKSLSWEFEDVKPEVYLYYKSSKKDEELLKWVYNIPFNRTSKRTISTVGKHTQVFRIRPATNDEGYTFKDNLNYFNYGPTSRSHDLKDSVNFIKTEIVRVGFIYKESIVNYEIKDKSAEKAFQEVLQRNSKTGLLASKELYHRVMNEFEKNGKIEIVNAAPYHIDLTWNYPATRDILVTKPNIQLAPGERYVHNVAFRGATPNFSLYAKSSIKDSEFIRWNFDLPYDHVSTLYHEGDKSSIIPTRASHQQDIHSLRDSILNYSDSLEVNYFIQIKPNEVNGIHHGKFVIKDYNFESVYVGLEDNAEYQSSSDQWADAAKKAYENYMDVFKNKADFTVKNITPFDIYFCANFQYTKDRHQTIGWYKLVPGEERNFTRTFYGSRPQISIYAETASSNADIVRVAYGLSPSEDAIVHFQSAIGNPSIFKPVSTGDAFDVTTIHSNYRVGEDYIPVQFTTVYSPKVDSLFEYTESVFEIVDNSFPLIYEDKDRKSWTKKAISMNRSLQRQVKYNKDIVGVSDMPYILGITSTDENGIYDLGVTINSVRFSKNIIGQDFPFEPGDMILEFAGEEVFTHKDLTMLLNQHAKSPHGGIGVPISFTILRAGELYSGKTLYFFNPEYDDWPKSDWWKSVLIGIVDAFTLGFDYNIYKSLTKSDPSKAWNYLQLKARLRQLNKGWFLVGNLGGAILSPGRLLLQKPVKRSLSRMGLRGGLSSIVATTGLEVAEGVIWTYGSASPLLTKEEFSRRLREEVKFTAGFGFTIGSLNLIRKW